MSESQSPTFCVMPWTNLATETNGKCKICCIVMSQKYIRKDNGEDFHIHEDPIEEIFDSSYVRRIRETILKGEWHNDCSYCKEQESNGSKSPRVYYNEQWYSKDVHDLVERSKVNELRVAPVLPTSLEPRPGTTCNLKCNTCWSMSSSKIQSERKNAIDGNLGEIPDFLKSIWTKEIKDAESSNFKWHSSETYLKNVQACMPSLKRLYFTGGEPALIQSNRKILKDLIDRKKTDLIISFTTNLTVLDKEMMDLLSHFSRVEISGSIDAFGVANDYIRYPSQWDQIVSNMNAILEKKMNFIILSVIQIANIPSFIELLKWLSNEELTKQVQVLPTLINSPNFLRPEILPRHLKMQALDELELAMTNKNILEFNRERLKDIHNQIIVEHPESELLLQRFREYTRYLDRTRNTQFSQTFPHLACLFN